MLEQLKQRRDELQNEYNSGQTTLVGLQQQVSDLQETLLRIAGAIQVLDEEIAKLEA